MEDQVKTPKEQSKDIDLGTFLYAVSKAVKKLVFVISSFFIHLAEFFLYFLLFLKRRIIWIVLSAIIGFAYGSYLSYSNGNKYHSTLTARFNFDSRRALYNTIEYFNSLVNERRFSELSKIFSISEKEASSLVDFHAEAVKDESVIAELYKNQFLEINRSTRVRADTFWVKAVPYKNFKNDLTKYDIPLQKVTVTSTRMDIFPKIQVGLIANIASNDILKRNQGILQETQRDEEKILMTSLNGLDTLRSVYNERLRKQGDNGSERNTLSVLTQTQAPSSPELELYDKVLELRDELKLLRYNRVFNQDVVQVLASFNSVGQRVSILKQNAVKYTLEAIALCLAILVIIEVYKSIGAYEKRVKIKSAQN
jgi:hypothetical protein